MRPPQIQGESCEIKGGGMQEMAAIYVNSNNATFNQPFLGCHSQLLHPSFEGDIPLLLVFSSGLFFLL